MPRFKGYSCLVAAALTAIALPAAAQEILRVPYITDIGSFDPDNAFEVGALSAINNVYEGLVEYAPGTTDIVGLLAEDFSVSDDGLTYTFDIVDGATFHDGTPVNAQAVLTALDRRGSDKMMLNYFLWNVTSITAPDDDTVVITMGMPQPSFLDTLASPWGPKIISAKAIADHGDDPDWFIEHAVGTGPFKLTTFDRGSEYVLTKFDDYYGEKPFFDTIELPVVPDIGQQILQLRAGDIDAIPVGYPYAQLAALPPGLDIYSAPAMALVQAFVKPGSVLEDPEIRKAVLTAIAPDTWIGDAFADYATPALSLYQAAMLTPEQPVAFPADMDAAKAIIEAHGGLSLTLGYGAGNTDNVGQAADLMAANLAAIGVDVQILTLPAGAVYGLKDDLDSAPDLLITRSSPDAAHPDTQASVFYTTGAVLNLLGASLPEADDIVGQAFSVADKAEAAKLYEQAGHLWFDAGMYIPLADIEEVVVHAAGLTDIGTRPVFPPGNIDFGTVRWAE